MSQEKNQLSPTVSHSPSVDHQGNSPPTQKPKDKNEHVIPWEERPHGVHVRCFAGYDLNFNGWIRRDVREQREGAERRKEDSRPEEDEAL